MECCCLKREAWEGKDHLKRNGNIQLMKGSSVPLEGGQLVSMAYSGKEELKRVKEWAESLMLNSEKLNGSWQSKVQFECLLPT